jgi:hypothetical protein
VLKIYFTFSHFNGMEKCEIHYIGWKLCCDSQKTMKRMRIFKALWGNWRGGSGGMREAIKCRSLQFSWNAFFLNILFRFHRRTVPLRWASQTLTCDYDNLCLMLSTYLCMCVYAYNIMRISYFFYHSLFHFVAIQQKQELQKKKLKKFRWLKFFLRFIYFRYLNEFFPHHFMLTMYLLCHILLLQWFM